MAKYMYARSNDPTEKNAFRKSTSAIVRVQQTDADEQKLGD